ADTVKYRRDTEKYSRKVLREEIRKNDYNLNIPRYVDSSEKAESYDIYASMFGGIPKKEIEELSDYWKAFHNLKEALFIKESKEHYKLKSHDIKSTIINHQDVKDFKEKYRVAFDGFKEKMENDLINEMENLNIAREKSILAEEIFARMGDIPLIDEYR